MRKRATKRCSFVPRIDKYVEKKAIERIYAQSTSPDEYGPVLFVPIRLLIPTDFLASPEQVPGMAEDMRRGDAFPPIVVCENGEICDGHHRREASLQAGYTLIPVRVWYGWRPN